MIDLIYEGCKVTKYYFYSSLWLQLKNLEPHQKSLPRTEKWVRLSRR